MALEKISPMVYARIFYRIHGQCFQNIFAISVIQRMKNISKNYPW